jgi:DNA-directed RNA polymerase subunit RPC12/RpoP
MGKKEENTNFKCVVCKKLIKRLQNGTYRNHCPFCLSSLHLDDLIPGDRKSSCGGIMIACRIKFNGKKGWQIIHRCIKCGVEKSNKIAEGDIQPDDWNKIINLTQDTS